jgi:hypothetical protein
VQYGFCGGSTWGGDAFAAMTTIDAATFARTMLVAEGFGEATYYEPKWMRQFETMFHDVFGDGPVTLEDDPPTP